MQLMIGAVIAWVIMTCCALYMTRALYQIIRVSLGFTGKLGGEVYFCVAITIVLWVISYFLLPFELSMKAFAP